MKPTDKLEQSIKDLRVRARREADEHTLAEATEALGRALLSPKGKRLMDGIRGMHRITKIAAVLVIAIGLIGLLAWLPGGGNGGIAWANVQERIRSVRSATFTWMETDRAKAKAGAESGGTVMVAESGMIRMEIRWPARGVLIIDMRKQKLLALDEKTKTASLTAMSNVASNGSMLRQQNRIHQQRDWLAQLKNLVGEPGVERAELDEKQVDGRRAKGYRITKKGETWTLWVDVTTALPFLVEVRKSASAHTTLKDFQFDAELDESLFSLEVPSGYELLAAPAETRKDSLDDLVELLRMWAERRDGSFPDELTWDFLDFGAADDRLSKDEARRRADTRTRGFRFHCDLEFQLRRTRTPLYYTGKDVKLGDGTTPIYWYRLGNSKKYQVIYGDLTIRKVDEKDLPVEESNRYKINYGSSSGAGGYPGNLG